MPTITVEAKSFLAALRIASSVTESRSTIPILSCVRITGTTITGSDLDIEASAEFPATGDKKRFGVCLPARNLLRLVSAIPESEEISLSLTDEGNCELRFSGGVYRLPSIAPSDFPDIEVSKKPTLSIRADELGLSDAMRRVAFAISTEQTRYYLNGVCLARIPEDKSPTGKPAMCAVATDGHRLAAVALPDLPDMEEPIIPAKAVQAVCGIGEPLNVEFLACDNIASDATRMRFAFAGATVTAKLIDGRYPDFGRVVPKMADCKTILTLDRKRLSRATRRLAAVATDRSKQMHFRRAEGGLFVAAASHSGAAVELIGDVGGEVFEIGFNGHYVADLLRVKHDGDSMDLHCSDPASPAVWYGEDMVSVLMPLRCGVDGYSSYPRLTLDPVEA